MPEVPAFAPRYNIAPGQDVLVVRTDHDGQRRPTLMRWGLGRLVNIRSESATGRPSPGPQSRADLSPEGRGEPTRPP